MPLHNAAAGSTALETEGPHVQEKGIAARLTAFEHSVVSYVKVVPISEKVIGSPKMVDELHETTVNANRFVLEGKVVDTSSTILDFHVLNETSQNNWV